LVHRRQADCGLGGGGPRCGVDVQAVHDELRHAVGTLLLPAGPHICAVRKLWQMYHGHLCWWRHGGSQSWPPHSVDHSRRAVVDAVEHQSSSQPFSAMHQSNLQAIQCTSRGKYVGGRRAPRTGRQPVTISQRRTPKLQTHDEIVDQCLHRSTLEHHPAPLRHSCIHCHL